MTELDTVVLRDPESTMTATFVPAAGMIGTSFSDGHVEFLGQRRGLDAYLTNAKTMGIPLLYRGRIGWAPTPTTSTVVPSP